MPPVACRCAPESANPAHLYSAALAQVAALERHEEELSELRSSARTERAELREELASLRANLVSVLEQHALERGARRVWQLVAAAVPTLLVAADLLVKLGTFK